MENIVKSTPWSVRDAKSHLSEVLRCARERGPQLIGKRDQCVVVSREAWEAQCSPDGGLVSWLLENSPGVEMEIPARGESGDRPNPFETLGD